MEWHQLLHYLCFAYNTSVDSSTSFTPFFLMFGQQAHVPTDFLNGRTRVKILKSWRHLPLTNAKIWKILALLSETPCRFQKANEKIWEVIEKYRPGDKVLVRLKARPRKASKLRSPLSDLHLVSCHDLVITLRNPQTNEVIKVHDDRLSNSVHYPEHPFQPLFEIINEEAEPEHEPDSSK